MTSNVAGVDGYFEETKLHAIREGDPARVKLMGHREIVSGHVGSLARGINVPNAQANAEGVAAVNPIFTWLGGTSPHRFGRRTPARHRRRAWYRTCESREGRR